MEWSAYIDGYCERLSPDYWAEPVNALTNAAFVLVALGMWRRTQALFWGRVLVVNLATIGVGSFLFHTHAQTWAALADVVPILLFILIYFYVALSAYWTLGVMVSVLGAALFIPYALGLGYLFAQLPFFLISASYWPVAVLILGFAYSLRGRAPKTAAGLAIGGALLCLSLIARSLDERLCDVFPVGTHFLWHVLNAVMLGWMIEVYRRHMLAGSDPGR